MKSGLTMGKDGKPRCFWAGAEGIYAHYHDEEWGRPVYDDRRLFEKICLEGFQAGLSWITILKKRERLRQVFCDFEMERLAAFTEKDVARLLLDPGIIRHRGKIEASINNAGRALEVVEKEGSLSDYFWQFMPPPTERPPRMTHSALMKLTQTETSLRLSKDLKKRGFRFVGPTTCYAFMQAMGLVNDHLEGCAWRDEMPPPMSAQGASQRAAGKLAPDNQQ